MSEMKKYLKTIKFEKHLDLLVTKLYGKRVLIYGAGLLFETAFKNYNFKGLNIIGISDKKFEDKNSPEKFYDIKTYKPNEIDKLNIDYILIAVKDYTSLSKILRKNYNIETIPLFKKPSIPAFKRCNIQHNIFVERNGLHGKKPKHFSDFQEKLLKLQYKLGRLDIPQIEFNLTTRCTLKCKHCSNFIPQVKPEEHCIISIEEFKIQLDNLLKAVSEIKNLLLIGGEPLLVRNIHEYLEYAASKKKVKRVWIVTNGTLLMNDNLLNTAKKYKNKLTIWVSNYSKNPELDTILKHNELLKQINDAKLDYDYVQDLTWGYTSPLNTEKLRDDTKQYFEDCSNHCVAVFGGKIYVCPRAGIFDIKNIYKPEKDEIINLNTETNPNILRKKLKSFYSREGFSACKYCTVLKDREHDRILPAQQIK